jgi:hypothetical protein
MTTQAPKTVSMVVEVPENLFEEMQGWLELNPGWTPARTATNALSLFLLQRYQNRTLSRHYLDSLFLGETEAA